MVSETHIAHLDSGTASLVREAPGDYTSKMVAGVVALLDPFGGRTLYYRGYEVDDREYDKTYGRYGVGGKTRGFFTLKAVRGFVDGRLGQGASPLASLAFGERR